MPDKIGPHLLGRLPSPPDPRDYPLELFLSDDPVHQALAKLLASTRPAPETKIWAKLATDMFAAKPPAPPSPSGLNDVVWTERLQLDQGDTGHCVGFGWADWGNTAPVEDKYANADGDAIYYECKIIDGEPGAEDGTYVRSGAKVMQNLGRLNAYAFTTKIATARTWLRAKGPLVIGSEWTEAMFTPDANGYVKPSGASAGGHCYIVLGDLPNEKAALCQNSWGSGWNPVLHGMFKMLWSDIAKLLRRQGECCTSVELP